MVESEDSDSMSAQSGLEAVERRLRAHVLETQVEPVQAVTLIAQEFPDVSIPALIYVLVTLYDAIEGLVSPDSRKDARLRLRLLEEAASLGAELYALQVLGNPAPTLSALLEFREEMTRMH